jgi:phosphatidylinositol alpha-1,6-mannosyltransferase
LICKDLRRERQVEGFGLVFLEANAYGKPVVAGCSGGVPDAVADGESGFLVDPLDPEEVAARLIELLADPGLAARLGRAGRARIERQFNWNVSARQLVATLRELTADEKRRPSNLRPHSPLR